VETVAALAVCCPLAHDVTLRQTRSVIGVGAAVSYSAGKLHEGRTGLQTRSEVRLGGTASNSLLSAAHSVIGAHRPADVGEGASAWYSVMGLHATKAMQPLPS